MHTHTHTHTFLHLTLTLFSPSMCISVFPPALSIELRIAFVQEFVEVREDMGPAAITLQASEAVSQPFTFRLDSRLLPPADDAATGESDRL